MNERRARHLLPRPCGVKPHPFTPPLLPPTPRVIPANPATQRGRPHASSFLRKQESRGAVPGRGTPAKPATQRNRPHASSFTAKPATQRGRPHSRNSRKASNPEGRGRGGESLPPLVTPAQSLPRTPIPGRNPEALGSSWEGPPQTGWRCQPLPIAVPAHPGTSPPRPAALVVLTPAPANGDNIGRHK